MWSKASGRGSIIEVREWAGEFLVYEVSLGLASLLFRFPTKTAAIACARDYIAGRPMTLNPENIVR